MSLKEKDFTPLGTKINGAYENDRNTDCADLLKDIVREAFGVRDVIVGHHVVYQTYEKRIRKGVGDIPDTEFSFPLTEEIPSADTLIFDHDIAAKLWGPAFKDVLVALALEPVATRDQLLAKFYYSRQKAAA